MDAKQAEGLRQRAMYFMPILAGLIDGDGCINVHRRHRIIQIILSCNQEEVSYISEYIKFFQYTCIYKNKRDGTYSVRWHNSKAEVLSVYLKDFLILKAEHLKFFFDNLSKDRNLIYLINDLNVKSKRCNWTEIQERYKDIYNISMSCDDFIKWLAGFFMAEGSVNLRKRLIQIANANKGLLQSIQERFGGSICRMKKQHGRDIWMLSLCGQNALNFATTIFPYTFGRKKRQLIQLIHKFATTQFRIFMNKIEKTNFRVVVFKLLPLPSSYTLN